MRGLGTTTVYNHRSETKLHYVRFNANAEYGNAKVEYSIMMLVYDSIVCEVLVLN